MSKTTTVPHSKSHRRLREERRRKQRRQKQLSIGLLSLGVVIVVGLLIYLFVTPGGKSDGIDLATAPVNYDQPLHAVHEMDAPGTPKKPIPFLPKDGPQPAILIPTASYDFGSIGATDVVTHDFVIANTGEAPLTISRAYTTCGCTTADITSAVIPPGETAIVTLRLDAGFHDVRGQTVRRGLIIENNDPKNSQMEIWIQASIRTS